MDFLKLRPEMTYPAAINAPRSASALPNKLPSPFDVAGMAHISDLLVIAQDLLNITTTLPNKAIPKYIPTLKLIFSLRIKGDRRDTHMGVVVTKTTELVTDVSSSEVIHAAK